jgi:Protein of unknown function (DUF2811)
MITEDLTVELLVGIPESLHESVQGYLETHRTHSYDDVVSMALSLFILQNRSPSDKNASRIYLNTLFRTFPPT